MELKKYELKTNITKALYERVAQEATVRRTTMAKIVRDGLTEYFMLREELANALEAPGNLGEAHTGKVIHTLLARSEERFQLELRALEEYLDHIQKQQQRLTCMLDQLYLDLMQVLPNNAAPITDQAKALAQQRYQAWLNRIK